MFFSLFVFMVLLNLCTSQICNGLPWTDVNACGGQPNYCIADNICLCIAGFRNYDGQCLAFDVNNYATGLTHTEYCSDDGPPKKTRWFLDNYCHYMSGDYLLNHVKFFINSDYLHLVWFATPDCAFTYGVPNFYIQSIPVGSIGTCNQGTLFVFENRFFTRPYKRLIHYYDSNDCSGESKKIHVVNEWCHDCGVDDSCRDTCFNPTTNRYSRYNTPGECFDFANEIENIDTAISACVFQDIPQEPMYSSVAEVCYTPYYCGGIHASLPKACNHGTCVAENECVCPVNVYGDNCEVTICQGIMSNDTSICGGHGTCVESDFCFCSDGYLTQADGNCILKPLNYESGALVRTYIDGTCSQLAATTWVADQTPIQLYDVEGMNVMIYNDKLGYLGPCPEPTRESCLASFNPGEDGGWNPLSIEIFQGMCIPNPVGQWIRITIVDYSTIEVNTNNIFDRYYKSTSECVGEIVSVDFVDKASSGCTGFARIPDSYQYQCISDTEIQRSETNETRCNGAVVDTITISPDDCFIGPLYRAHSIDCGTPNEAPEEPEHICWGISSTKSYVCYGHGECTSINNCECVPNYYGHKCHLHKCDGIDLRDTANVCSGFGECKSHDNCQCLPGFSTTTIGCDTCDSTLCGGSGTCTVTANGVYSCSSCGNAISGDLCNECTVNEKVGVHQDGICYYSFPKVKGNWQEARDYCKVNFHPASDLAVIPNEEAHKAFRTATGRKSSWILLSDGELSNDWKWMDGVTPYSYIHWNPGYPDSTGNCVYVHYKGLWMNHYCYSESQTNRGAITCALDMNDLSNTFSSNSLLNVGYKKFDFSSGWCDWTVADNCDDKYQLCNGNKQGENGTCSNHGDCLYDSNERENYCDCIAGWEGSDCEVEDVPLSGYDCEPHDGYCYKFFKIGTAGKTWNDARNWCKSDWDLAADLAVISSYEVQEIISEMVGDGKAWIGALDFVEGTWNWVDHSPMGYTKWIKKDDAGDFGEDCAAMESKALQSKWSTNNCAQTLHFVCGLKIIDAGTGSSSDAWVNVKYENLNTNVASCECTNPPCPVSGCP